VPRIDTPLLLDVLLGLVILLFVPFGIRRGAAKEAMVSAGILFGALLAERFAQTWGAEVAARFTFESGLATFIVSAAILFASTFLLGYGGGGALGRVRPGTLSRLVGGLLAAFNAGLLLSYLLGWIDGLLAQGAALDDGILSRALLRQTSLLLLAAAGVLLALTVLGWIVNAVRARRQPRELEAGMPAAVPPRQRPVRVAPAADAGKYEPDLESIPRTGRFGPTLDATSPLPAGRSAPWTGDNHGAATTNDHHHDGHSDNIWQRPERKASGPGDETVWAAWGGQPSDDTLGRTEPTPRWPVSTPTGVTDDERCAVCRARVGPRDVFCPECGATL
jgi:uncharacterized membrane protein required for colicin V production/HAMP domain-containing protein